MILSDQQLEAALRAMADALEAGIGVATLLENEAASATLPAPLRDTLRRALAAGGTLATGFAMTGLLGPGELALLRAGEKRGHIGEALVGLADAIAARRADRHKMLLGMAYPALLLGAAGCITPLPRILSHGVSGYLAVAIWGPLLVVAGALFALVVAPRLKPGSALRALPRRLGYATPLLGAALRRGAHGTFLDTLGRCLAAGMPAPMSLQAALVAADEPRLLERGPRVLDALEAGGTLVEALGAAEVFHPSVMAAVAQGELTGKLEATLPRAAAAERAVARRAQLIAIGVLVVVVALAVLGLIVWTLIQGVTGYFETIDGVIKDAR